MSARIRTAVIQVHRWTGVTIGLVALYLALTGGWIVLRPVLDPVTYPRLLVVPACTNPLPVDTLAAAARAFHPGAKLTYVYLYGSQTASAMVRFSDADQVYVDPCSGKVLGDQPRYGGLYGTAEALHKFKFLPASAAMPIIGTTSLVLASLLVVGGLYAWWPRRKAAWKHALTFDRKLKGRALALRLHTTTGAYASAIIFVVALTAVPLSLGWAKSALFTVTGTTDMTEDAHKPAAAKARAAHHDAAAKPIAMQTAWREARALVGGPLLWGSIHYAPKGQPVEIGIVTSPAPHGDARNYVFVDAITGKVVEFRPWVTLNAGSKLYYWALAVHTGRAGGLPVQLIMLAGMLGMAVIGYAGIDSFLRKNLRRRRNAPQPVKSFRVEPARERAGRLLER
ncbi:MAG TPA: PepSY-associated TM helix domain-containing protein [Candidatus Elarobacter sp.]|nr:PepSY-associated TM helix domain-containing protein [Candidatus Elarobacter sp.]